MPRATSRVLVITGMHRSGTSLVASLLRTAGLDVGDRLLGAARGNPRGHFEDVDFVEFHRQALFVRDQHVRVVGDFVFRATADERRRARALVEARAGRTLWGWKDPRTSLFLDFWDRLLPGACYVLLYRHPIEVLLSLVHRADVNYGGLAEAIESWSAYNRAILAFRQRRRARTLLCEIHALVADVEGFGHLLRDRLRVNLPMTEPLLQSVYAAAELQGLPDSGLAHDVLGRLYPAAAEVLVALDGAADMPSPPVPAPGSGGGSPEWARLVPVGADAATCRAWLTLLVSRLAPAALEALHDERLSHDTERERAVLWLQDQQRAQAGEIERLTAEKGTLRDAVIELERGKAWLEERCAELERGQTWLEAKYAEIERAKAWLDSRCAELERGKAWLEQERGTLQSAAAWLDEHARAQAAEIERLATERTTLLAGVAELERGQAWLAGQYAEAQRATAWLEAQRVELEKGKAWLESHADAQAAEIERLVRDGTSIREALAQDQAARAWCQDHLAELERGKAWLADQVAELARGKAWLEEHAAAQSGEIERWRLEYERLKAWTLDREGAVATLTGLLAARQGPP